MGQIFRDQLKRKLDKKLVIEIRGKGLMNAVVLNPSKTKSAPYLISDVN